MLIRERCSEQNSAGEDRAGKDDRSARPAVHEKQDEGKREIKLIFNRERPGVRERGAAVEANVLDGNEKFPPRIHFGILAPGREKNVDGEDDEISRDDPQRAAREEAAKIWLSIFGKRREQLAADQITAQDEEKIDTDPAKTIDPAGQFESEQRSVINDDHDDGERAEKIETGLAFAILKAWIYRRVTHRISAPSPLSSPEQGRGGLQQIKK